MTNSIASLAFASAFFSAALALLVAWKERRSIAHWSFVAGMFVLAAESTFSGLTSESLEPGRMDHWRSLQLVALSFLPGIWLFFSLSYARGNYREFLFKWRFILVAAFLLPVGIAIGFQNDLAIPLRPTGVSGPWRLGLGVPGILLHLLFLVSAVLVLMNLERTFRAAVGALRWRIKFMVLGVAALFAVRSYSSIQFLFISSLEVSLYAVNSGALILACLLMLRSLFRAGHFEVTVYPSDAVLRNSLTFLLVGIYLFIVGVFTKVIAFFGGDAAFTFIKAFLILDALVLLGIVLLSERARLHLNRFISRQFQRPAHDYRSVWRSFTKATARQLEQAELCRVMASLVSDLFQVLSVTVWLVDDRREGLIVAASTSLSQSRSEDLTPQGAAAVEIIAGLRDRTDPFDMNASLDSWMAALRRCQSHDLPNREDSICAPLTAGGEVLGFMVLANRVGGVSYSLQDLDLLKCVADQAAASLLNIHLSQRLMQARELEAFQTMSAFFVHDLKNSASTLSLMLQNLPVHFDNPAFREDALSTVAKTVSHINGLIGRLGLLRENLAIRPIESDFNELVSGALKCLDGAANVQLVKGLNPLPKLLLDPEQIQKVVTNLALNAKESMGRGGKIGVGTDRQNSWAVLSVSDTGCGMSRDFVRRCLFRPFQTTKKQGIGIGMFQCKMIVEAHRGRIEVETEVGKGTTFRVMLPLYPQVT